MAASGVLVKARGLQVERFATCRSGSVRAGLPAGQLYSELWSILGQAVEGSLVYKLFAFYENYKTQRIFSPYLPRLPLKIWSGAVIFYFFCLLVDFWSLESFSIFLIF